MTTPTKKDKGNSRYALFLPFIFYHSKNPVNIFKDILTMNLDFRSLGDKKQYLTYKMIHYGEYKANWLAILWCSVGFLQPLQVMLLRWGFLFLFLFSLCIFSLSFFIIEFNYSYYLWAIELKNHLLSCIFSLYLIYSQLFISAMLLRLGSKIAYLHRAKKAGPFTQGL